MKPTKQHNTQQQAHKMGMRASSGVRAGSCDICELQAVTGSGRARFLRYYYDVDAGACQRFIYGGGGDGNENNFETLKECETACR